MIPSHVKSDSGDFPMKPMKERNITDFTVRIPSSNVNPAKQIRESKPSRWGTREFKSYYLVFVVVLPLMVYSPIQLSSSSHPNYSQYAWRLSPGWLFGRQVDNSDAQYSTFRSNFFHLSILALIQLTSSYLRHYFSPGSSRSITFPVLMLFVLHGVSAFKILFILWINYHLAKVSKPQAISRIWPALIIIANMGVLLLNEKRDGHKLASLHIALEQIDNRLGGLLPRWHVSFNITMLRMVSFALDYHWRNPSAGNESPSDYRQRVTTSLPESEYNAENFIAYCLYPPLYIAGPIMTFNDFVWQLHHPLIITWKEKATYLIRFAFSMLTMEVVLHTMYVVAIKDTSAWEGDGPADLSMIGFWNLVVVWLKLLIPWRFFRLWALLNGMDPPENMIRCVANNYSTLGFWRSWHRSYNLWVVRYIYIPVGGNKRIILGTVLVFTFVALWHDLSFKLLAWGWLVSLFILPELIARRLVSESQYGDQWWYRHVTACGGVANILMMMSANLVGFVLGLDGMKHLLKELLLTGSGWTFTLFSAGCLFIGVQVMFEYREEELRRGIDRKC